VKVETLRIKVLRSEPNTYANDEIEISVTLDDGDDWKELEPALRNEAVALIEKHWVEKRAREAAEEAAAREAHFKQREAARNEWLGEEWESNDGEPPCNDCSFSDTCSTCEHLDEDVDPQPF
jgi:hypothetical protein